MRRGHHGALLRKRGLRLERGDDHIHVGRQAAGHHGVDGDLLDGRNALARIEDGNLGVGALISSLEKAFDAFDGRRDNGMAIAVAIRLEVGINLFCVVGQIEPR